MAAGAGGRNRVTEHKAWSTDRDGHFDILDETFDILGRVTARKQTTDGTDYTSGYSYNLSGALIEQTYPSGRVVKNVLDSNGDLSLVQSKKNSTSGYWNYASSFSYNAAGAVTSMQLGNGRWESTTFNSRLQPIQIALGSTPGATNLLDLDCSYGTTANNGNVMSQTITVPTVGSNAGFTAVQSYSYDSLNRLKDAIENITPNGGSQTQSWKQTFTFDRYGNRRFDESNTTMPTSFTNQALTNPTISTSNNRLNSTGWDYDSSGNTTDDPNGTEFVYDAENKQVKVTNGAEVIGEYWYDGDGKRVRKHVPSTGEVTAFVYDASGKLIAEYSTIVETSNAKVAYVTNDHLGSPRINTDANGAVTSRHDYHPFGEEIATSQRTTGTAYVEDTVRKQFTGYERDDETDLDFAQARMYSNTLGRFNSVDPILITLKRLVDPQRLNLFGYCRNNPLLHIDPDGEDVVLKEGMTKKEVDQLIEQVAKEYLKSEGVYNFLNNEERSSTKLILHNGDLSAADDKNRITYGQTVLSSNGDISVTVDFARQEAQTTKNNLEHAMGKDELEEPPSKQEVVREELSHAVDARTDPKGYLQAAAADKTFQGKRDDKPSEKRRIAIENSSPMQERTSKAQVKDGEAAVKQIKNMVDYEKYKFKN